MAKFNYLFLLYFVSTSGWCATIQSLSVNKNKRSYDTQAEFIVDAPQTQVFAAFTEFENLATINPSITASSTQPLSDEITRVTTQVRNCVGVFCKSVTLVEDVTISATGRVVSTMVEGLGDFKSGETEWTFVAVGNQTRVLYRSRVQPGFWVPPLVGKRAMRKSLQRQIVTTINNLEAMFTS